MVDDLSNGYLLKIFEDLVVIKDMLNSNGRCNLFNKSFLYDEMCVWPRIQKQKQKQNKPKPVSKRNAIDHTVAETN